MGLVVNFQETWTITINFHHQTVHLETCVLSYVKAVCRVQTEDHVSCVKVGNIKQFQSQDYVLTNVQLTYIPMNPVHLFMIVFMCLDTWKKVQNYVLLGISKMSLTTSVQKTWTITTNFHHQTARPQTCVLSYVKAVCLLEMEDHVSCVKVGNIKQLQVQGFVSTHVHWTQI